MRWTAAGSATFGSSSTSSNEPVVSSSMGERLSFMRSGCLGVKSTSGLRTSRRIWRRRRWKYCAAVVALQTWMLSSAAQREEALDAGRGVLGALALVAVGQEQDRPGGLAPLVLGGDEVLVDDDLGAVDEVAELRLPRTSASLLLDRVAVLVADGGVLRQQRVADPDAALDAGQVGQRRPRRPGLVVDEHGVALAERPPPAVLAGQADVGAFEQERTEGELLGGGPVDLALLVVQLRARRRTGAPAWGGA